MKSDQSQSLNMETVVLKVNVDCHGCRRKVKKILKKIEGVYAVHIDAEQQRAVVIGVADSDTLIKKLARSGKHAELWFPKSQQPDLNQELMSLGKTKNKNPVHNQSNNSRRAISVDQLMYLNGGGSFGSDWGFDQDMDMELEEAERPNFYLDPRINGDGNYENDIGSMISMMGIHDHDHDHHHHGYHDHRHQKYDVGGSFDSGRFQRFQNYPAGYGYQQQNPSPLMVENLLGSQFNQNPYGEWLRTNPQSVHAILNNNNKTHDAYARMYNHY
ncbi:uncharacterized protein [Spinacia oleracea]|uniref:HMA domain-containing protein n=1 Tax=Spinacia oleracea TaxID=3562 RepID=A0A9R0K4P8_SPIOL|nr:uncharacterized protein LOC110797557 [Spinacia oleracea]